MKMRTVLKGVLGVAVTVAATAVIPAGPAQAAYVCSKGEVCLYEHYDRTGSVFVVPFGKNGMGKISDFRAYTFFNGTNLNDKVSSIDNRSDHLLTLYSNVDLKGPYQRIYANTKFSFSGLRFPNELKNDQSSSLQVTG
ncbi:peptidase inhibitor family I36 protein [Paractinoplanes atraurantiacus]|uniref:Peptidase inhibitor family I36 n=1 Tax=Paractinoplanes atraurantiacus TaxID=1036182 RepID=A0A285GR71_9ACTN|nr:peptidase inhibitor family I36 protein [Actinoplanes atraurantiacus]SNY25985.1 Peptidase inhibitor family I36 [Actinoplanes atraurantiacus]